MAELSLARRVAIVTGAGRGIGEAIALRLASGGADVAVVDLDLSHADEVSARVRSLGRNSAAIRCDVSNAVDVREMTQGTLDQFGQIDILVNNAGVICKEVPLAEVDEAEWDRVMAIDLKSVFLCCKAVLPYMVERRYGKIVNIASISGKEGAPNLSPYAVAKAGIICLTKSLAREVVHLGVHINCVAPALIETPLLRGMSVKQVELLAAKIPMGRLGRPDEVAAVVHFLVSDDASFITGQCYDISGGRATY